MKKYLSHKKVPLTFVFIILIVPFLVPIKFSFAFETISPTLYQRTVRLTGLTKAKSEAFLSSEVSGRCAEVYAEVGEPIPSSGKFAQLDTTFIDLDLKMNSLEQKKIRRQLENEQTTLDRYTQLKETNVTTQARFDEVLLSRDLHEIELQNLTTHNLRLKERRDRHTITAPAGWLVVERMVEPGEFVQPGKTIAKIGDFSKLIVPFSLSVKELDVLKNSAPMLLFFPDLNIDLPSQLHTISPGHDEKTRKVSIELVITSTHEKLIQPIRGGMRAELSFMVDDYDDTFEVPYSAILSKYDSHWVMRQNKERQQVIILGTSENGMAIISSPELTEKDMLIKVFNVDLEHQNS